MNNDTQNARFWEFINGGYVKITLRPGQELSWRRWERTEDGWSSVSINWEYSEGWIFGRYETAGRDCDGRSSQTGLTKIHVTELTPRCSRDDLDDEGYLASPSPWQSGDSSQYDQFAELAGY